MVFLQEKVVTAFCHHQKPAVFCHAAEFLDLDFDNAPESSE